MFLHAPPFAMFLRFTCSNNTEGGACMKKQGDCEESKIIKKR